MGKGWIDFAVTGLFAVLSPALCGQAAPGNQSRVPEIQEFLTVDLPAGQGITLDLKGTSRLPKAEGKAEVKHKEGMTQIEVELDNMQPALLFGGDINTYVLWLVTPEGQVQNLGELIVDDNEAELKASTPLSRFGIFVTAEPHFLVDFPSHLAVLKMETPDSDRVQRSSVVHLRSRAGHYDVARDTLVQAPQIESDQVALDVLQARTAVRLAERLGATQFASAELKAARQALQRAEEAVADGSDPEDRLGLSREAVRLAVQAQATAEERLLEAQIAEEHRRNEHRLAQLREAIQAAQSEVERARLEAEEWRLKADMEQQARQQAMQRIEELRAETARAEERGRQQGLDEARDTEWRRYQELVLEQQRREQRLLEAERALRQAEQAQQQLAKRQQDMQNQEAVTEQQRADLMAAQQEVERAQALLNQAREQVDQARLEAQQAKAKLQKERQAHQQIQTQLDQLQEEQTQTLKQLRNALGPIVETRETMEGLVLNVPDTLFEFDSARLKPQARKVLEKVAEALKAVGDYRLTIEGHTDNVGRAEYNQELSRARADSVREFLIQSGVDSNLVVAVRGLGEQEPIASNDSAAGREDNRRVEILVQNPAGAPTRAE